mgnify:CR=1 FL=1
MQYVRIKGVYDMKIKAIILSGLLATAHTPLMAEPEPMMTKGDLCAYLGLSARQQENFLAWAYEKKKEDFSDDPLYLEALVIEIDLAENKKTHYESMMNYSECDSSSRWHEKLVPEAI